MILAAVLVSAGLTAACAHVGGPSRHKVSVTRNESDVQGCQMISKLRANSKSAKSIQSELEDLTRSLDGNVLYLSQAEGTEGVAYRCATMPLQSGGR
jgi:hypothetical protein